MKAIEKHISSLEGALGSPIFNHERAAIRAAIRALKRQGEACKCPHKGNGAFYRPYCPHCGKRIRRAKP